MRSPSSREEYRGSSALLAELTSCGRTVSEVARPGLWMHDHADEFEVCLIDRGEVEWHLRDGPESISAGEIVVTAPGERHGSVGSIVHQCELFWFRFVDRPAAWSLPVPMAAELLSELHRLPSHRFRASPELAASIRGLVDEHRSAQPRADLAVAALTYRALVLLIRESATAGPEAVSAPIRRALVWMAAHLCEDYGVVDVARVAGLSPGRLQARFARELRCSVGEKRTRLRIAGAKHLITTTDRSILDIGTSMGFSSSQYFATVFGKRTGSSPTQFREAARTSGGAGS